MKPLLRNTGIAAGISVLLTAAIPLLLFASPGKPVAAGTHFFLDTFLVNITFMGDSIFAFGVVFFLLFFLDRKDISLRLLLSLTLSLAMVQLFKNVLSPQPVHLYFEEGVPAPSLYKNIISSHTAVAFTMAVFFAMHGKNILLEVMLFGAAFAVAYSRIYFGAESFASLGMGLIPAAVASLAAYRLSINRKTSRVYKKRREQRVSPQHLMPA
jgi:membrane-associated phospholipid phosphatase